MSDFKNRLGREIMIFDGALGTVLQSRGLSAGARPEEWCLTHPDEIVSLHREYIESGADIIKTNTFGANPNRYNDCDGYTLENVIYAAVTCAKKAVGASGRSAYIALDIGPLGRFISSEGDNGFDDAVSDFARIVRSGASECDLVLLETFGDIAETRAALLAVKENCNLPVVVTNVYGADGRMFTGSGADVMFRVLEGMGADAVGMNCSLGPDEMLKILPSVITSTSLPVALNPNAGLPHVDWDGKTVYNVTPRHFADVLTEMARAGASLLGGCCGTTPEHIRELKSTINGMSPSPRTVPSGVNVTSATRVCTLGNGAFTVIGERINPTGKPKLKAALREGNIDYILSEAHAQAACGADILDINTGLPDIDEKVMLDIVARRVSAVTDLPLQLDSSDPVAMEAALRHYNGKALINSVNGSEESMSSVLPLASKYGGVIVALTLDGDGIPDTAEGRYEIAKRIIDRAAQYGIGKNNIIVDPLALTLGADPDAARKTLAAVRLIRDRLGVPCSLGVSNVSFGLPERERVNCDFLTAALEAGLDVAIMNPMSAPMISVARGGATQSDADGALVSLDARTGAARRVEADSDTLTGCVLGGMKSRAAVIAAQECVTHTPTDVISGQIVPALERAGRDFESGKIFLPGLLACADAAIAALGVISAELLSRGESAGSRGKVVLATVQGDVHDIGKNIVGVMLKSYGFDVIDLGRDVPPERVVTAAIESGASLVGLSALMTTTLPAMGRTITALKAECPDVKTVVGGAVLGAGYAAVLGADAYASDAMETVRYAAEVYSK